MGMANQKGMPHSLMKYEQEKAPTPRNAPCPREIWPVNPVTMLMPNAPMTAIPILFITLTWYGEPRYGNTYRRRMKMPMHHRMNRVCSTFMSSA